MLFFITSKAYKLLYTNQTFKKCQHLTKPMVQFPHIACTRSTSPAIFQENSRTDWKIHIFACPVKLSKSCSLHLHLSSIFQPAHVRRSFSLRRSPAASQRKACCCNQTTVILPVLRNSRSCSISTEESSLRSFSSHIQRPFSSQTSNCSSRNTSFHGWINLKHI